MCSAGEGARRLRARLAPEVLREAILGAEARVSGEAAFGWGRRLGRLSDNLMGGLLTAGLGRTFCLHQILAMVGH